MSRPLPKMSSGQKQSLANLSRAQSHDEAARRKLDAMGRELDRSFSAAREELDRNSAWSNRYGHWLARVALLPILALAVGMVFVVGIGLWSGEIKELNKYSKLYVTRADSPIGYWASVIYHGALAAFIAWIAVVVFRGAKIGRKNAT